MFFINDPKGIGGTLTALPGLSLVRHSHILHSKRKSP